MGPNQSTTQEQAASKEVILMRIGGNAIAPITDADLLATVQQQQHPMRCFRVANGDWYKVVYSSALDGLSTITTSSSSVPTVCKVITAKHLFIGTQPPSLQRVLILPVESGSTSSLSSDAEEDRRSKLLLPRILTSPPARVHLDVGDVISCKCANQSQELFAVVDVEPGGGGIVDATTEIFVKGEALKYASRVRFAPAFGIASETDREQFRGFLKRQAGELFLQRGHTVQDDSGKHWTIMDIEASPAFAPRRSGGPQAMILAPRAMVSIGWNPEVRAQTECLHCFRMVTSPFPDFDQFAFGCPQCGFLVPNPIYPTWIQADLAAASSPAKQLLNRLRSALSDIHASDVRTLVIGSLITRLPKQLDGTLDWRALDEVAMRVLASPTPAQQLNSTPEEVLSRLPVFMYVKPLSSSAVATQEEEASGDRCEICLEDYVEGVPVRTLPCFHRFHVTCSDNWLALATSCPLCKTEVDLSMPDDLLQ